MKRLAGLLAAASVLAGTSVLLAAPAQAQGVPEITYDPGSQTLTVRATRDNIGEVISVNLKGPGGVNVTKAPTGFNNSVQFSVSPITYNGLYVATSTSTTTATKTSAPFPVSDPPTVPAGVVARPGDVGVATMTWNDNIEPDLTGYRIVEGATTVKSLGLCGGTCSTTLNGLTPGRHSFAVVAIRKDATGGSISSGASTPSSVTVAAPPPPPTTDPPETPAPGDPTTPPDPNNPAPQPTTTTGAPGNPGAGGLPSGQGPSPSAKPVADQGGPSTPPSSITGIASTTPRKGVSSFGGFSGFGTALSVPGLGTAPAIAGSGSTKIPDGTYEPQLAYSDRETDSTISASGDGSSLGPIGHVIDSEQLMRTLAAALILLLAGAHLRRWLSDSAHPTR